MPKITPPPVGIAEIIILYVELMFLFKLPIANTIKEPKTPPQAEKRNIVSATDSIFLPPSLLERFKKEPEYLILVTFIIYYSSPVNIREPSFVTAIVCSK